MGQRDRPSSQSQAGYVRRATEVQIVEMEFQAWVEANAAVFEAICPRRDKDPIEQAHRADEFVALEQLEACAAFLRRVAARAAESPS